MPSEHYNLDQLKSMVFDDLGFLQQIVQVFLDQMPIDMHHLTQAMNDENWQEVSLKAHKIKSSVRTIGIHRLEEKIEWIEKNSHNTDLHNEIIRAIESFEAQMDLVIRDLKTEKF